MQTFTSQRQIQSQLGVYFEDVNSEKSEAGVDGDKWKVTAVQMFAKVSKTYPRRCWVFKSMSETLPCWAASSKEGVRKQTLTLQQIPQLKNIRLGGWCRKTAVLSPSVTPQEVSDIFFSLCFGLGDGTEWRLSGAECSQRRVCLPQTELRLGPSSPTVCSLFTLRSEASDLQLKPSKGATSVSWHANKHLKNPEKSVTAWDQDLIISLVHTRPK